MLLKNDSEIESGFKVNNDDEERSDIFKLLFLS